MNYVDLMIQENPNIKIAVIDKDEPGGICLTRGCIPSKILLYPAELVRTVERGGEFGIEVNIRKIDFRKVMDRMRTIIYRDIEKIRRGLKNSKNIGYYPTVAEFVAPYTLKAGDDTITAKMIYLCTGSKPTIPSIEGLEEVEYQTSDTILRISQLPRSIAIVGGGYIAAEYGHFFSAMGSKVTIIGRNPQFLPEEEPEVSALAKRELQKHMTILTNYEVRKAEKSLTGEKILFAYNIQDGRKIEVKAEETLIAAGRSSNADILHPERGGIEIDKNGWIVANEYMETTQPNAWAFGDADGRYPFKHVANYESSVVYYNSVLKERGKVDYHAVPHAVFIYPEIASVGLKEEEAIEKYSVERILIGIYRYQDTAKGEAMAVKDYFVKVIVEKENIKILGAHIIGPHASALIQEIINLMYTPEQTARPLIHAMHIHPALSEVVARAFQNLMQPGQYHHLIEEHYKLTDQQ